MISNADMQKIRRGLALFRPAPAHQANTPPAVDEIYAPAGHESALDPDRPIVVGGRGVGKSFWASALLDENTRKYVSTQYPRLKLEKCDVVLGFGGVDVVEGGAPSAEILEELVTRENFKPEIVWRAVFLSCLRKYLKVKLPTKWGGKDGLVSWANADAERLQLALRSADKALYQRGLKTIVVFDALDRLGANWTQIRALSRALLRVALAFQSYKSVKPKIFIRVDQAEDQSLIDFPDASKLFGGKVDLVWERYDLFGLLYSLLVNDEIAKTSFRGLLRRLSVAIPATRRVSLPEALRTHETIQIRVFNVLAGQFMGTDPRRGKTYSWVHNHLSDAFGRVSPRSFLEAIRAAAEATNSSTRAIDPKGIQAGLQAASSLRVIQLREEFQWIGDALKPLADLRVPCDAQSLFERWKDACTIETIKKSAVASGFLVPVEFDDAADLGASLLDAMMRIGVAERRADGRINVPDIYRVAAKLLKRGGVRPPA